MADGLIRLMSISYHGSLEPKVVEGRRAVDLDPAEARGATSDEDTKNGCLDGKSDTSVRPKSSPETDPELSDRGFCLGDWVFSVPQSSCHIFGEPPAAGGIVE